MFHILKIAYILKYNSNCQTQVILLMISNG